MTDVVVTDDPQHAQYVVTVDGAPAGLAAYERHGDVLTFTHTQVDDAHAHHGVGGRLVQEALDDVRARGLRVVPQCPFVAAFVDEHPAYADLVV